MMSIIFSHGNVPAKSAGIIAKYFATSLAIEKVVKEPLVIKSCFPDFHHFDELGGVTIQIHHVGCFFGCLVCPRSWPMPHLPGPRLAHRSYHRPSWPPAFHLPVPFGCKPVWSLVWPERESHPRPLALAIVAAVSGLSPVIMTVRRPILRSRSNLSCIVGLQNVFKHDHVRRCCCYQRRREALLLSTRRYPPICLNPPARYHDCPRRI